MQQLSKSLVLSHGSTVRQKFLALTNGILAILKMLKNSIDSYVKQVAKKGEKLKEKLTTIGKHR